jgi:hypothetical protein
LEVPLGESNSFVAAPWVEQHYDSLDGWRAEAVVGFKRAFHRSGDTVMAVQAGALWMSHPAAGCSDGGGEVRWLGGRSFGEGGFVDVEAATRALEGGCAGERLDLTAGYRPRDNWLAMGQAFLDAPWEGEETVRAQLSLVRCGRSGRGIQQGLRARVNDGIDEPALRRGLCGRPGD